jgi:hypothetical protein
MAQTGRDDLGRGGAEAMAVVRAWLKSDRWDEAMRLRPPPQRTYQRQAVAEPAAAA